MHAKAAIRNSILRLLPPTELEAVLDRSEMVTVRTQELVCERDQPIPFIYFPENGVISLVTVLEDGDQVEAMTIGNDGFTGLAVFNGLSSSMLKGIGQITGEARRVAVKDFRELFSQCEALRRLLHRYCQFTFETVS